jgi:phosphoribosylformylglycinamidine cyclo-ligase
LHTNGFSLARRVLFEDLGLKTSSRLPELRVTLGEELLRVHKNYQPLIASLPAGLVHAAAHITGGGLIDNLPRVLPKGCQANIRRGSWRISPIFQIIQRAASVDLAEMYNVFNMGIGMVLIVPKKRETEALRQTHGRIIGEIVEGSQTVALV